MLKQVIKHFNTITRHRHKVILHCAKAGILWQGLRHDLSKYSPTEFWPSVKYYQGFRSPIEQEREEKGMSVVWMHHQGRNRHHFEYWKDYNPESHIIEPVEMPIRFVIEMICDRVAASKIYYGKKYTDQTPLNYLHTAKHIRTIHPKTDALLEELLTYLAEHGEKALFKRLRALKKDTR